MNLITNKVTKISQMNNKSNSNSFYISWVNDDKIGYMKTINGLNNLIILSSEREFVILNKYSITLNTINYYGR